jgi:hypothetical protein
MSFVILLVCHILTDFLKRGEGNFPKNFLIISFISHINQNKALSTISCSLTSPVISHPSIDFAYT